MKFNNKIKVAGITLLTALVFGSLGSIAVARQSVEVNAAYSPSKTYTNGDGATYYNGISSTATGSTLLSALQSLNNTKRQTTVGYSSMGTTPSGAFCYTDYDPSSTSTDSKGQKYGSKILSFYSGTSTTSWNREHVWPNSHGGGSGGSVSSPYCDSDIHMPRPTITAENSNRGNSFYVEGMAHSSNGWDPVTAFKESGCYGGTSIRGECARIIFYCMVADSDLKLADSATVSSNSGCTMGKLSDMLKWNLENPVNSRELNRNEGAEYLQGNRNPFIDHPEYACKIWGDTNSTTKSICANASTTTKTLSKITVTATDSENFYVSVGRYITLKATATYSDSTTADITSSVTWTSSNSSYATVDQTGKVTGVAGSASGQYLSVTATLGSVSGTHGVYVFTEGEYGTSTGSSSGDSGSTDENASSGTILPSDLATSYETSETLHTAASGIKFYTKNCAHFSSNGKLQFKASSGYLRNAEAINLSTVTLNSTSGGSFVVYGGTSSSSITTTITGSNGVYNLSGYTYFKISAGSNASYCTSIDIASSSSSTTTDSLSLNKSSLSVTAGSTGSITATASGNVTWKSSNTSVATVSASGTNNVNATVTGVAAGTATITATCGTKTATCTVTITASTVSVTGVTLSPTTLSLEEGKTGTLSATISPSNATNQNVTWSTSNSSVATVSNGVVTAVAAGSATITVKTSDGSKTATCAVTVTAKSTSTDSTWPYTDGSGYIMSYTNASDTRYFVGDTRTNYAWYGETATDKNSAAAVYFETNSTDGNHNLYCYRNSVKTYIKVIIDGTHINFNMTETEPTTGWTYDSDKSSITFAIDGAQYYIGSSGTYTTFSCNTSSLITYPAAFEAIVSAESYAESFLSKITCSGTGTITFSATDWSDMSTLFSALLTTVQNTLKNASANAGGTTIEQCVARYDAVVAKYSSTYNDFMSRSSSSNSRAIAKVNDNVTLSSIVSVALITSITLIGSVALTRKRKED